jgi:dCTP deaminase
MTILSAQSIRKRCVCSGGMISPFFERGVQNGKSFGLSSCSYDVRIAEELELGPHSCQLASTIEQFNMPTDICGFVVDKSSWARVFVSAFNTLLDPGWRGYLTLELANISDNRVLYNIGDPVAQIVFQKLDEATDLPYRGKYNDQEAGPQRARFER